MVYDIRDAVLEDIPQLENISQLTFDKFKLIDYFQEYDKESVEFNFKFWIATENIFVRVITEDKKILGFSLSIIANQTTSNNRRQLVENIIQIEPELPKITKGKILMKMIDDLEELRKEKDAVCLALTISAGIDISKFLLKAGFKQSDIVYVKGGE